MNDMFKTKKDHFHEEHDEDCTVCKFKEEFLNSPHKEDFKNQILRDMKMLVGLLYEVEDLKVIPQMHKKVFRNKTINGFQRLHEGLQEVIVMALWKVQEEIEYDESMNSQEETRH